MNLDLEKINNQAWSHTKVVQDYTHREAPIQLPEAAIFMKYRDSISNARVLELGCGGGRTAAILKQVAKEYRGIDYQPKMIQACRDRFSDDSCQLGDMRDLSRFANESFDFVLSSFNSLDYVSHDDRVKVWREVRRLLKPNGLFVFSSHNRNYEERINSPKLILCVNPITQIKNLVLFFICLRNLSRNKEWEIENKEYAVRTDWAHDFQILTYYVDKNSQINEVGRNGFKILEMYDTEGCLLQKDSEDQHSCWIYYVTQKI